MNRFVAHGAPILTELPQIHILPTHRREKALPDRLSWEGGDVKACLHDGDGMVRVEGTYEFLRGSYVMTIKPNGQVIYKASFEYTGEDILAREIGIRLSVPRFCDTLLWDRRAEWSGYPADHIGRPTGKAKSFAPHHDAVPPAWPWSEDNTPMGSNDFRSAKRNIYWAALTYPDGPAIVVDGQGKKHVRAFVEGDRISFHVLDWYGGTGAELWEWTANYGEGKRIARGQRMEMEITFRVVQQIGNAIDQK
jgi:hypothetical protein